jgi:hypothetical protein
MKCYKQGRGDPYRRSSLDWPHQPSPPRCDWKLWENTLNHLEDHGKLTTPISGWLSPGHQRWLSYYDPRNQNIYIQGPLGWTKHSPILRPSPYTTRSSTQLWFSLSTNNHSAIVEQALVPASILLDPPFDDDIFSISISPTTLPSEEHVALTDHILRDESNDTLTPHPYYLEILQWDKNSISMCVPAINDAITLHDLHICADGASRKTVGQGSHAWVFSTSDRNITNRGWVYCYIL